MSILREALTDENGQGDIAYIAIGALTAAAIGALTFIFGMSAWDYFSCRPLVKPDVVVNCSFSPLPIGQAAGLIFGAFATLIGALAGYMVATRRQPKPQQQTILAPQAQQVNAIQPVPAEAATEVVPETKDKPRKGKR